VVAGKIHYDLAADRAKLANAGEFALVRLEQYYPEPVAERWAELGGEEGDLGRASGPATDVAGGSVADFERGTIVLTPAGRAFVVQGAILEAYREAGGPEGELGFPTSDETTTDGGWVSAFENGSIAYVDGRPVVETR